MCVFVGLVQRDGSVMPEAVTRLRDALKHRGPDDGGVWLDGNFQIGSGHRGLAGLDLSSAGHQATSDQSGRFLITFNGEIYNFGSLRDELVDYGWRFRTNTDTEVMLYAYRQWGKDWVRHFNGMFAFGIFDSERKKLWLSGDRLGEKPLY